MTHLPYIFILLGQTEYGRSGEIDNYIFRVSYKKYLYTKKLRHISALFGSSSWKYKCYWPDFNLDGL